jgi:hypothetical protein
MVVGGITILSIGATLTHSNQPGRFQLGVGEGEKAYVIDTVSGQVWERDVHKYREFIEPKAAEAKF